MRGLMDEEAGLDIEESLFFLLCPRRQVVVRNVKSRRELPLHARTGLAGNILECATLKDVDFKR